MEAISAATLYSLLLIVVVAAAERTSRLSAAGRKSGDVRRAAFRDSSRAATKTRA